MNESTPPEDKNRPEEQPLPGQEAARRPETDEEPPAPEGAATEGPETDQGGADDEPAGESASMEKTEDQQVSEPGDPDRPDAPTPSESTAAAAPAPRGGRALAAFALIVALAAAAASGYVAWMTRMAAGQADSAKADLSGELGALEAKSAALEDSLVALEREWRTESGQIDQLSGMEGRLQGRITALETRTAALARTESVPPDADWRLEEIEFLLRLANRQVGLARDPVGAEAALQNADMLLADLADPAMQPVRRQLADDILSLRSLEQPDVEGLALRLGSLARRVESLPLASQPVEFEDASSPAAADSGWERLKAKFREFFASIFQVRKAAGSSAPLLSPEEAFFLKRNLELELQAARVALLMANEPVYRASVGSARRWAEEHFLTDDPGVQGFVEGLLDLEGRDISVDLPDVSASLRIFSEVRSDEDS